MCELYELLVAAWAVQASAASEAMLREAKLRVAGLLGRSEAKWTLM
jgi:hypothetical protein